MGEVKGSQITKEHEEILGGDINIYYFDCNDGFINMYIC